MNETEIQAAASRREQQEAALFRPDGSKVYGEQEHKEREREIDREFATTMDKIQADIEQRVAKARGELTSAEVADPAGKLRTDEIQRAAALGSFVADEVADLPLDALARRVRVAASGATEDRAASYALLRHASRRQDEDLSGELRDAIRVLGQALDPDAESRLAAARGALEEAEDLQFKAQLARVGANDLGDAFFGGGQGPSSYWTGAAS